MSSKQFVFHGCCTPSLGPGHPAAMLGSTHIHKQVCFEMDSSSWPYITTNKWLPRDLSSTPTQTLLTDSSIHQLCPALQPFLWFLLHHWGNPVKRNPNQLELDQLEAEGSNKIKHGCFPGNQDLCISTHLLCPTLGPKTDLPVTTTSPCSLSHPHQHCYPTTCALLLSKAVQHSLHHSLPFPCHLKRTGSLWRGVCDLSLTSRCAVSCTMFKPEIPSATHTGQLCTPSPFSAGHSSTSTSWNAAVVLIILKGEQTCTGETKPLPSVVTLHTWACGCCSNRLSRLVHNKIGVIEDWAGRALLHVHRSGRWGTR